MLSEGVYVYCIIVTKEAKSFGPIGIGGKGDPVTTIAYKDLSAVVSSVPMDKYMAGLGPMLSHERVLERVMTEHALLPMRFCTVAPSAEEVRGLLRVRHRQFRQLLSALDNKVELGLKALWKDMGQVMSHSVESVPPFPDPSADAEARHRQWQALEARRAHARELLLGTLRPLAADMCLNRTYGDDMVFNAAFLVDRSREREFDTRVGQLSDRYRDTISFKYVGPAPPHSFVNMVIGERIPAIGPLGKRR